MATTVSDLKYEEQSEFIGFIWSENLILNVRTIFDDIVEVNFRTPNPTKLRVELEVNRH